ncbi:MAG: GDP-mannose 4,6 dehydratase [Thermoprotei archaeon]|nr:MAG: GDP-mannose 4,6 dehydratase [Thermoprotei archaeon]
MNKGRAFITGISGFVGPHLAERLLELGYEVYGLVRRRANFSIPQRLVETGLANKVKLIEGDVMDLTNLISAIKNVEPNLVYHLAAQTFVPKSFKDPLETFMINSLGTQNILEAIRISDVDCRVVYAGSSEEYGLQFISEEHYRRLIQKYGVINPEPTRIPELPIDENNPLRPVSPYAVSKVHGDYLFRIYYYDYGLKTVVSRAFNHEGPGRGANFVTSTIVIQCLKLVEGARNHVDIGDVNVHRDWSHVLDIIDGYVLIGEKGRAGGVYVQGSMRTNSVLTFLLLTLRELGYEVLEVEAIRGGKRVKDPLEMDYSECFGIRFEKSKIDRLILNGELRYELSDKGLNIRTDKGVVKVIFDPKRFRPVDVPVLLSNPSKAMTLGFNVRRKLSDVVRDLIRYWRNKI